MSATVFATHRFVAFHRWQGAAGHRFYLGERHRHVFHVRVDVRVEHDDRDIEFHDLTDFLAGECSRLGQSGPGGARELGGMSCEMIARHLGGLIVKRWPGRTLACEVSEDGECGSRVAIAEDV